MKKKSLMVFGTRFTVLLLILCVLSCGIAFSSGEIYGLTIDKLSTRLGPGTQYKDGGTYNIKGQYIHVISRAWDDRNDIWWVKCEIPYRDELRVLWTGYKRFDKSTLPLESIPIEGEETSSGITDTYAVSGNVATMYRSFVSSGQYQQYLRNSDKDFNQMLQERDRNWDRFALYDMDRDGSPELFVYSEYSIEQIDVFTCVNAQVQWIGKIGGDNFFQWIFLLPGRTEVFATIGGPAMEIDAISYSQGIFQKTIVGNTVVDSEGMSTTGIKMYISDNELYQALYEMLVEGSNYAQELKWISAGQL